MADRSIEIVVKGSGSASGGSSSGNKNKTSFLDGILNSDILSGIVGGKGGQGAIAGGVTSGLISSGMLISIGVIAGGVMLLIGSSKALHKTIGVFMKMIMLILKPIGDVVSVLLMPLIWILMPLVRAMNLLFLPLRRYLMMSLSSNKDEFSSLNPIKIVGAMIGAMSQSFGAWFSTLLSGKIFEKYDKDTGFYNEKKDEEGNVIGIETSNDAMIQALWEKITGGILAFFSFTEDPTGSIQSIWNSTVLNIINWFNLEKPLETAQALFNNLTDTVLAWIGVETPTNDEKKDNNDENTGYSIIGFFSFLGEVVDGWFIIVDEWNKTIIEQINVFWTFLKNFWESVKVLVEVWKKTINNKLAEFWEFIINIWESAITTMETWKTDFNTALTNIGTAITGVLEWVAKQVKEARNGVKEFIKDVTFGFVNLPADEEKVESGNDFVITPTGKMIKTNPSDYLFGTKNPTITGEKGGHTFNFNVNTIHTQNVDELKRKLDSMISESVRRYI